MIAHLRTFGVVLITFMIALASTPMARAQEGIIVAGTNSVTEVSCNFSAQQVRIDSTGLGSSRCLALAGDSGWVTLNVEGAYGIHNRTDLPIKVAFKLPFGQVYWQEVIQPNQLRTLDIDYSRSTVVEIQYGDVASEFAAGQGELTPGEMVSLRTSRVHPFGDVLSFTPELTTGDGAGLRPWDLSDHFADRLDATFKVVEGLANPECISLEMSNYPGAYMTVGAFDIRRQFNPSPEQATWCIYPQANGEVRLSPVNQPSQALGVTVDGRVSLVSSTLSFMNWSSTWAVDPGLAWPKYEEQ